jgi:hypothetical protein
MHSNKCIMLLYFRLTAAIYALDHVQAFKPVIKHLKRFFSGFLDI